MDSENRGLDLEKELTCSICTEVLYHPLTLLDCLHTFCGACLKEWFSWQLSASKSGSSKSNPIPFTCPSCRAPVRETKHNATVTTLLDMFLVANPAKARTAKEKEDSNKKYKPGEDVIPIVEEREKSLMELRIENEDQMLVDAVREASLRDVSVEGGGPRHRRGNERSRESAHRSRDSSRDNRSTDARDRRRRPDGEGESERRRRREDSDTSTLRPDAANTRHSAGSNGERRRRRSDDDARRRNERASRTAARQIEHQSSLRSLISSSDVDSREMEEEILRQIQEEGLLEGIDVENITVNQQDQISERIAEAFRRRQREKSQANAGRRSEASSGSRAESSTRESTASESLRPSEQWHHSTRPSTATSQTEDSRSSPRTSSSHLEVTSPEENRRRRRTSGGNRVSTSPIPAPAPISTRPNARSQTDLSERPRLSQDQPNRPINSPQGRSSTEPIPPRPTESLPAELPIGNGQTLPTLPPQSRTIVRPEDTTSSVELRPSNRAPPPAAIAVSDSSLVPAPLSPRRPAQTTATDRATVMPSPARPMSSSFASARNSLQHFPEPFLTCSTCFKAHIEYDLHYNCYICANGDWNICLSCYRSGRGCKHWFGFGYTAWTKWEQLVSSGKLPRNSEGPHMLTANRYIPPRIMAGGADGRRTITTEDPQKRLQSGAFCSNCQAWANECFWRCDLCNEGDWGFCNNCVNQGRCCTHHLLPLKYQPSSTSTPPLSPAYDQQTPSSAALLIGPDVLEFGSFKPLTFRNPCEICHSTIHPTSTRYHCFCCTSTQPNRQPGDYDICMSCYSNLVLTKRISPENGYNGWRRCPAGHRMIIVGFIEIGGGQRRVIENDLVGGRALHEELSQSLDHAGLDLQQWSWADGKFVRLVTTDVAATAPPSSSSSLTLTNKFPPDGGVGMRALVMWSWYPKEGGADDELLITRGAEVRECVDVNGDWFHGVYMGAKGLFPAPYVKVLDKGPAA